MIRSLLRRILLRMATHSLCGILTWTTIDTYQTILDMIVSWILHDDSRP